MIYTTRLIEKIALGTLLTFFAFPERYSEYNGTQPTPYFLPSLIICHGLASFSGVFSLTIDLLGHETRCKRNKLIVSLTVNVTVKIYPCLDAEEEIYPCLDAEEAQRVNHASN